jgi:hypothetical protein
MINEFEDAAFKCWPCRRPFNNISNFRRHNRSPYHEEKMKQLDATMLGPSVAQTNAAEPNGVPSAEENDQSFAPVAPAVTQPVSQSDVVQRTVAPQVVALTARQVSKQSVLPQAKRQSTAPKASTQSNVAVPVVAPRAVVGASTPRRSPSEPDVVQPAVASSAALATRANVQSFTPMAPTVPRASSQATRPRSAAPSRPVPAPSTMLASSSKANPFKCEPCGANPKTLAAHNTHIATPKHKRLMAIAEKRKKSNAEAFARHQVWLDERAAAARQLT